MVAPVSHGPRPYGRHCEKPIEMAAIDEATKLDQDLRVGRTEAGSVSQDGDLESSLYVDLSDEPQSSKSTRS